MKYLRQVWSVTTYNFKQWHKNPRIFVVFALAFILSFLLSGKVVAFSESNHTTMQLVEAFVWTFGDSNSILLAAILLVFLFVDMPFLSSGTPLYLVRTSRRVWITGQVLYIFLATAFYLVFVMASTVVVCARQSFAANMWSPTAATLGYSPAGQSVALPVLVKTLEMSRPYQCMAVIFLLMLCYSLVMVLLMLTLNLFKGSAAGILGALVFSIYGFLLKPGTIAEIFQLPDELYYKANVLVGWISPLNQATYHMHNFGYDLLPRMWQSFAIFLVLIVLGFVLALRAIRNYNFNFVGTEG